MALLYGWQRKVALLPASLLVVGWVIFSIGFIWLLVDLKDAANTPVLFSSYVVLVGGPFVYVLGVAQAVLPGIASSIVGVPTAFVSSLYLVSAGFDTYGGAYRSIFDKEPDKTVETKQVLMFVGALLITICWCFVMMLSVAYKSKPRGNQYQVFDQPERHPSRKYPFTPGVARVLTIPFIILTAIGWCVAMVGFVRTDVSFIIGQFAVYGLLINGPLLFLAALLHAGCFGGASTVMGVFSSILSSLYTMLMGFLVVILGQAIYSYCKFEPAANCSFLHSSININLILAFSGSVGSLFFWTFVILLWPFFQHHPQNSTQGGSAVINATNPPNDYGAIRLQDSVNNTNGASPSTDYFSQKRV